MDEPSTLQEVVTGHQVAWHTEDASRVVTVTRTTPTRIFIRDAGEEIAFYRNDPNRPDTAKRIGWPPASSYIELLKTARDGGRLPA